MWFEAQGRQNQTFRTYSLPYERTQKFMPLWIFEGLHQLGVSHVGQVCGLPWLLAQSHACFLRRSVALFAVTAGAAGDKVIPVSFAPSVLRNHMVNGQTRTAIAAILACVVIAYKNTPSVEPEPCRRASGVDH